MQLEILLVAFFAVGVQLCFSSVQRDDSPKQIFTTSLKIAGTTHTQPSLTTKIGQTLSSGFHELSSSAWVWGERDRRNILYVKVPKTGSTTFRHLLDRLAQKVGFRPSPERHNQVFTEPEWRDFVNGTVDIFNFHVKYQKFLKRPEYWSMGREPLTLTMLRRPADQCDSKFRYSFRFCTTGGMFGRRRLASSSFESFLQNENGCEHLKRMTVESFVAEFCGTGFNCNEQSRFVSTSGYSVEPDQLETILDEFDFVLITERFDESLALLNLLFGFPLRSLFYLPVNVNQAKPHGTLTEAVKSALEKSLVYDTSLYNAAVARLDRAIRGLSVEDTVRFKRNLDLIQRFKEYCPGQCVIYWKWVDCHDKCREKVMREEP